MLTNKTTYETLEKVILIGQENGYFSVSEDRSTIAYRASGKSYGFKSEKEKIRAYFLVELIDKYGFLENEVKMDVELKNNKEPFDMVVYRKHTPYIVIDVFEKELKLAVRAKETLLKKASGLSASYAIVVAKNGKAVFDLKNNNRGIQDIPLF